MHSTDTFSNKIHFQIVYLLQIQENVNKIKWNKVKNIFLITENTENSKYYKSLSFWSTLRKFSLQYVNLWKKVIAKTNFETQRTFVF